MIQCSYFISLIPNGNIGYCQLEKDKSTLKRLCVEQNCFQSSVKNRLFQQIEKTLRSWEYSYYICSRTE